MTETLRREFDRIFDLDLAPLEEDGMQIEPDLNQVNTYTHIPWELMTMKYDAETQSRFSSRFSHYAGTNLFSGYDALARAMLPFDGPYHRHATYELTYVPEGRLTYVMGGQEVIIQAGEALLFDLNCVHFDRNRAEDAVVLFLHFRPDVFEKLAEEFPASQFSQLAASRLDSNQRYLHYRPVGETAVAETEERFAGLIREINSAEWNVEGLVELLACRLLFSLERTHRPEMVFSGSSLRKDLLVIEIDRYIRAHLDTVTAGDLVRQFHFNPAYFSRKIKQKFGVTLTEYIQQRRLERARQLLWQTDRPVLDVIEAVGYKNARYFYEIFKDQTGMTPAEYRESRGRVSA